MEEFAENLFCTAAIPHFVLSSAASILLSTRRAMISEVLKSTGPLHYRLSKQDKGDAGAEGKIMKACTSFHVVSIEFVTVAFARSRLCQ